MKRLLIFLAVMVVIGSLASLLVWLFGRQSAAEAKQIDGERPISGWATSNGFYYQNQQQRLLKLNLSTGESQDLGAYGQLITIEPAGQLIAQTEDGTTTISRLPDAAIVKQIPSHFFRWVDNEKFIYLAETDDEGESEHEGSLILASVEGDIKNLGTFTVFDVLALSETQVMVMVGYHDSENIGLQLLDLSSGATKNVGEIPSLGLYNAGGGYFMYAESASSGLILINSAGERTRTGFTGDPASTVAHSGALFGITHTPVKQFVAKYDIGSGQQTQLELDSKVGEIDSFHVLDTQLLLLADNGLWLVEPDKQFLK